MSDPDRGRTGGCWAVVPAKAFGRGKSRLSSVLTPSQRADLARALFDRVMDAVSDHPGIEGVLVLTDDPGVAARAHGRGAASLLDSPTHAQAKLGAIVDRGLARLSGEGRSAALVIMSDLPSARAADLDEVLAYAPDSDVVVVPDAEDAGTNALLVPLPLAIPTCFGHHDSARRHMAMARHCGLTPIRHRSPRLALDVDLPAHLDRCPASLLNRAQPN